MATSFVQKEEVQLAEPPKEKKKKREKRIEYTAPPTRVPDARISEEAWAKGAKRANFAFSKAKIFIDEDKLLVEVPRKAGRANSGTKTLSYPHIETLQDVEKELRESMEREGVYTLDVTFFAARYPDVFWNAAVLLKQDREAMEKWLSNDCGIPSGQRRQRK